MSRVVQSIVAVAALASYLAAASLDCEPIGFGPGALIATVSGAATHGLDASPSSDDDALHGHAHGHAHGDVSAPTSSHAPKRAHAHDGHGGSDRSAHANADDRHRHPAHAAPKPDRVERRRAQRAIRAASNFAVWKATCACGCGETRARVGGTLSRLGATVPGLYLARLPDATRVDGPGPEGSRPIEVFETLDPVPI